ncbi:6-phosphogluconolactonase [Paenibacillus spongiae]|uniref:Glucosamine-6-phosphate deaminase n=1 Tax=Paenibacillus spongiae TaxID=2909671 RepID=A0ABY5SE04_9BACL|nr:glucosamine-6-phosphate deaminase [Paenibacillus spongiae]UVI30955.1 glucosamine-6-phosphate deaminase [Paenibacillus spongiae]
MNVIITENYEEMSTRAAEIVCGFLKDNPSSNLGLTTGNTPQGLYERMVRSHWSREINLSKATIFSPEEYLGVGPEDYRSLYKWLDRSILSHCDVKMEQVVRLRGEDPEPQLACERFDQEIAAMGGIDLIVEGLGENGHIGFNEPGSSKESQTRIVALSEETIDYNYKYWNDNVPSYGLTIGMGNILSAKQILLLVSGKHKAKALSQTLQGEITAEVPASFLRLAKQLTVIADREAAELLED